MAGQRIDRDKLRAAIRRMGSEYVFYMLDDAIPLLPQTRLRKLIAQYLNPAELRPHGERKENFLADVKAFQKMPATNTLVSTTTRRLRFLAFGSNGNLRRTLFLAIVTSSARDFFFRDFADILCCLAQRFQKFFFPTPAPSTPREVFVEVSPLHSLLDLFLQRSKRHA